MGALFVQPLDLVAIVATVLLFVTTVALGAMIPAPVQTYLRSYALFVLGDTNDTFDAILERRRAVRASAAD